MGKRLENSERVEKIMTCRTPCPVATVVSNGSVADLRSPANRARTVCPVT